MGLPVWRRPGGRTSPGIVRASGLIRPRSDRDGTHPIDRHGSPTMTRARDTITADVTCSSATAIDDHPLVGLRSLADCGHEAVLNGIDHLVEAASPSSSHRRMTADTHARAPARRRLAGPSQPMTGQGATVEAQRLVVRLIVGALPSLRRVQRPSARSSPIAHSSAPRGRESRGHIAHERLSVGLGHRAPTGIRLAHQHAESAPTRLQTASVWPALRCRQWRHCS